MIPKQIFQTYPDVSNIPKLVLVESERFLSINKDYRHTIFSDFEIDAYVHDCFDGDIVMAYDDLKSVVAKTDFWRYLILYREGGVYLDMDAVIVCSLSNFFEETDSALITSEPFKNLYAQWALSFVAQHPILERVIEIVTRNIHTRRYPTVHATTGPRAYSAGVTNYCKMFSDEKVSWDDVGKSADFRLCKDDICTRFFGRKYMGVFKHKYKGCEQLYNNISCWREEQKKGIYQ